MDVCVQMRNFGRVDGDANESSLLTSFCGIRWYVYLLVANNESRISKGVILLVFKKKINVQPKAA